MSLRRLFATIAPTRPSMSVSISMSPSDVLQHHHRHRRPRFRQASTETRSASSLENVFISFLVTAGTCHRHRPVCRETKRPQPTHRRCYSSRLHEKQGEEHISREEYAELVNTYPEFVPDDDKPPQPPPPSSPRRSQVHYPLASRLTLTPAQESRSQKFSNTLVHKRLKPESDEHAQQLEHLHNLLQASLGRLNLDRLWEVWQALPTPRPSYLTHKSITRMFRHLAWTEFKNSPQAMQRYFLLLDEVLQQPEIVPNDGVWNSAISFAGRCLRNVSSAEVKSAVEVWMRMEDKGVAATEVTFNILYDLAVRAGRFALAGTIETELKARGLPLNRFFRTSVIYHAGLRRDGEAVRRSFRELVDAGEIVDTGVMNCVILSLLRAGEAGAASSVFFRMKALHEAKFGIETPGNWRDDKALGIRLDAEAKRLKKEEALHEESFFGAKFAGLSRREQVQRASPIAPDARTYRILIAWAVEVGELGRARSLLAEMKERGLKVYGGVYVGMLRGFQKHGGFVGVEWTARQLEEVWSETLMSSAHEGSTEADNKPAAPPVPETSRPTYFTSSLALAAIHAFYKCMGRPRMLDVWAEIEERWILQGVSEEDLEGVRRIVDGLKSPGEGD